MATDSFPLYGTPDVTGGFSASGLPSSYGEPIGLTDTSTFDPGNLLVDPNNTSDTGAIQDVSTPFLPSVNNPETAGNNSLGAVLNNAINAGFSAWQLASQPKGTPKVVTTRVGPTTVTSGRSTGITGNLFGNVTPAQQGTINLIILLVIGLIIYKLVVK